MATDAELAHESVKLEPRIQLHDIHGLWGRAWLRTPVTFDDSTLVLWMQAAKLHVDMRLPAGIREFQSASSLSDLNADELRLLATAEGFAGTTAVKDNICTWTRGINLQGPIQGIDTGSLRQVPEGLLESGLHSDYEELWHHEDATTPQGYKLTSRYGKTAIILWTKKHFALGMGWQQKMFDKRQLAEQVDCAIRQLDKPALAHAFDQEFSFGKIENGLGIIEYSTQPTRQGNTAFDATALNSDLKNIEITMTDFFGDSSTVVFQA